MATKNNYKVRISGNGTAKEIIGELQTIINLINEAIESVDEAFLLDGAEWECPILMIKIEIDK